MLGTKASSLNDESIVRVAAIIGLQLTAEYDRAFNRLTETKNRFSIVLGFPARCLLKLPPLFLVRRRKKERERERERERTTTISRFRE